MTRLVALAALAAAAAPFAPASATPPAAPPGIAVPPVPGEELGNCVRTLVLYAEPVPRTPEEYVDAAVRDAHRVVTFAGCLA
ncbi:MAG TPA: hypothetical protein VF519_13000 [Mycobacteriales bacterium]|jgi:hypothetical protein